MPVFQGSDNWPDAPARDAAAVTPSDTAGTALHASGATTRALYVGTTGNVKVTTAEGTDVTFTTVPAGAILPIRVSRVYSTNTTASNIVALY